MKKSMQRKIFVAFIFVFLTIFLVSHSQAGDSLKTNALLKSYFKALHAQDVNDVMNLFTEDSFVHTPVLGKVPARIFFENFFSDTKKAKLDVLGTLEKGMTTDGRQLTGYWGVLDIAIKKDAKAFDSGENKFEVVVIMELNKQGLITNLHIVMDATNIRTASTKIPKRESVMFDKRESVMLDKFEIAELINNWTFFRDQGLWEQLTDTFHDEGTISLSWFDGPFKIFVKASKEMSKNKGATLKHFVGTPMIKINGTRAKSR